MTHDQFEVVHQRLFSTPDGQLLLKQWKSMYVYANLFDAEDKYTYYKLGKRDLVLEIMDYLGETKVDIDGFNPKGDI